MKTIIAGSRKGAIMRYVDVGAAHLQKATGRVIEEVVCGMAPGVDMLGKEWAEAARVKLKKMPANWQPWGPTGRTDKAAGHKRNRKMGDYADALIAVWDGKSPGTRGMIEYATKKGLPIVVVDYRAGLMEVKFINI